MQIWNGRITGTFREFGETIEHSFQGTVGFSGLILARIWENEYRSYYGGEPGFLPGLVESNGNPTGAWLGGRRTRCDSH